MPSINKATVVGHLGRDPELRYFPDGSPVANLSVATSHRWKDKASGELKESTEWHRVSLRGQPAQFFAENAVKGDLVYIEGRLSTRKYEKDGIERFSTEIVADEALLLTRKEKKEPEPAPRAPARAPEKKPATSAPKEPASKFDDLEDDIPF